jgi:hypothetical protein
MELAIPIIALGGMFLISNKKNTNNSSHSSHCGSGGKEPFTQQLPTTTNFPTTKYNLANDVNAYPSQRAVTDKYFNSKQVGTKVSNSKTAFGDSYSKKPQMSLTGEPISEESFNHQNMVPFFGSKMRGSGNNARVSESILDSYTGGGSQFITKEESAPLFSPQNSINYVNGMPNVTDFLQSRVMPSNKISNVKPWEEIQVAPGLNQGYTAEGSRAGFNSGVESRELWTDRNVDELRTLNNPKLTFGLESHEGPAYNWNNLSAPTPNTFGKVEKYLPDKFYLNTTDRWFTTTGIEKAQTARAEPVEKHQTRIQTTSDYYGAETSVTGTNTYAPNNYQDSKRTVLDSEPISNPYAGGRASSDKEYGRDGYKLLNNNRTTTSQNGGEIGMVYGAIRSAVAPILDFLRPSRKENVIGNIRTFGDVKTSVPAGTAFNPADRAPTTIKETTLGLIGYDHLNVNSQYSAGSGYLVNPQQEIFNQRDSTNVAYIGNGGGASTQGVGVYEAQYNQHNNVNKIASSYTPSGNMKLYNSNTQICMKREEVDCHPRTLTSNSNLHSFPSGIEQYGLMDKTPQHYQEAVNCERINPNILDAFRNNPYTQSLHSAV